MTTQETIINLFNDLSATKQVELLTSLYYELDDYHKDQFLEETENA
jgi:hypothetical protein